MRIGTIQWRDVEVTNQEVIEYRRFCLNSIKNGSCTRRIEEDTDVFVFDDGTIYRFRIEETVCELEIIK